MCINQLGGPNCVALDHRHAWDAGGDRAGDGVDVVGEWLQEPVSRFNSTVSGNARFRTWLKPEGTVKRFRTWLKPQGTVK